MSSGAFTIFLMPGKWFLPLQGERGRGGVWGGEGVRGSPLLPSTTKFSRFSGRKIISLLIR